MSIDALMRHRATVEVRTVTGTDTAGQQVETWATAAAGSDVPCRLTPVGQGQSRVPPMVFNKATHVLAMRTRVLDPGESRIVVDGVTYTILGNIDRSGAGDLMKVYLEVVDS